MKKVIGIALMSVGLFLGACNSQQTNKEVVTTDSVATMTSDSATASSYTVAMVDNKKDPTCGMPITAGISDTAHYENHTIGFCSSECKGEFLKNPKAALAAAELK
jgi:YHS domain-containing protein